MILDGWGQRAVSLGNAVTKAQTPVLDQLMTRYPTTTLACSGEAVGLPKGIMGNSEVGHLNIGAGRIVFQDLLRIDRSIEDGSFFENQTLGAAMDSVRKANAALHLMGLVSDGGVHSQLTHLEALLKIARQKGLQRVYVHAIMDGRDTPPDAGIGYIEQLQERIKALGCGVIASLCGRYFAMDRDKRWDRVEKAHRLYTAGEGRTATDAAAAMADAYAKNETDEFINPTAIVDDKGRPVGLVSDSDGIIFFNFRADRAREITRALTDPTFDGFDRQTTPVLSRFVCMTLYDENFSLPVAFPPLSMQGLLGEVISQAGMHQLRIAETEKYAHVTYFFNGGEETPFGGEDRCLIPSPREVATYDLKPSMSAPAVTDEVLKRIESQRYDLIVLNFANMDMVGHTGDMEAAVEACETVDRSVGRIVEAVQARGGVLLITADHGNAETMLDDDGKVHTAHTTNPVALILVDDRRRNGRLREGILGDIAPTILEIMGITKPEQMTGRSLLVFH
jgi:2,3-bisphosphoglycerate-independent phosphoglycerate mutase